jgi:hypothetical protein
MRRRERIGIACCSTSVATGVGALIVLSPIGGFQLIMGFWYEILKIRFILSSHLHSYTRVFAPDLADERHEYVSSNSEAGPPARMAIIHHRFSKVLSCTHYLFTQ